MQITIENAETFQPGTKVTFNFGAMYAPVDGVVTRIEYVIATKYFPATARLWASYTDHETGEQVETTITQFTTKGIGTYLNEAVCNKSEKRSVWA